MSYSPEDDFRVRYKDFVDKSRRVHQRAIWDLLRDYTHDWKLGHYRHLDLGCGWELEARQLVMTDHYIGVDKDPNPALENTLESAKALKEAGVEKTWTVVRGDFMDVRQLKDQFGWYEPNMITSFFGLEVVAPHWQVEEYYQKLFDAFPSLVFILTSGFYYSDRRFVPVVEEAGGLKSYQAIGDLCKSLSEKRYLIRNPSELFGPEVVEVWKRVEQKV